MIKVAIQPEAFDVGSELAEIGAAPAGAVVSLPGIVRDDSREQLTWEIRH
jgi:molybdopterin synthase catalytic subunit